jgi:phosphopentomutase
VAIEEFGEEHLRTGALILYTSQDSVLQMAAHVERVPEEQLYEACLAARAVMTGADAVGRVIARPFSGEPGAFKRTRGRRDFSLEPPARSYLDELSEAGVGTVGVGKIDDLFAGRGLSSSRPGSTNEQALEEVAALASEPGEGLIFANLIETDQVYGHRKDVEGFAAALASIDHALEGLLSGLGEQDLLIVTADHGVDMSHPGTDHTREHVPLLAVSGAMQLRRETEGSRGGRRYDGAMGDVGATVLRWLTGRDAPELPGSPFLS